MDCKGVIACWNNRFHVFRALDFGKGLDFATT